MLHLRFSVPKGGVYYIFCFFFRSSASMLSCRSAVLPCSQPAGLALILSLCPSLCLSLGLSSCLTRRTDLNKLEVVFLHFEVWVADWKVFDVKFESSMSTSPRGQVLSRFGWIGNGFIRGLFFQTKFFLNPFMGLQKDSKNRKHTEK